MVNQIPARPFSLSEKEITGQYVLGSPEIPRVRVASEKIGAQSVRFSVTSAREVGRDFISGAMTFPLHEIDAWTRVEKGLREIAYPSRAIKKLHASEKDRALVRGLKSASVELADILRGTKDTDELSEFLNVWRKKRSEADVNDPVGSLIEAMRNFDRNTELPTANEEYSAKIPVFSEGEAIRYAEEELLKSSPDTVARLLSGHSDSETLPILQLFSGPSSGSDVVPGLDELDKSLIQNAVLRDVERRGWLEIVHRLLEKQFVAVREEAIYEEGVASGGGFDKTVYVLHEDMPKHLRDADSDIRIRVGQTLRDPRRGTDLVRHRVKFIRRKQITVAHPRVVWVNDKGVRHFEFPSSPSEPSPFRPVIAKPNSLIGAAIFANIVGMNDVEMNDAGIDYGKELDKIIGRRSEYSAPLARAGMLGLVLHTRQEELLSYPYFEMMEEHALQ